MDDIEGGDLFVAVLDGSLATLIGSTYLGASDTEWRPSIVLDSDETVFVCGETQSSDFATTPGAYDVSFNGSSDIFISKYSADLTTLIASTYFGAGNFEEALAMRLDTGGNVLIAGYTLTTNFVMTRGAFDVTWNGGSRDGIVAKFSNDLTTLLASTFIGGRDSETCEDLIISSSGDIYVTGWVRSENFPITANAYSNRHMGELDIFIAKFDANLTTLLASTFFGGQTMDRGQGIALDAAGNVFISGQTSSFHFPVTPHAYDRSYGGNIDNYLASFDRDLTRSVSAISGSGFNPPEFKLHDNYPNPFNPATTINFDLPATGNVSLIIYNLLGEQVVELENTTRVAGVHQVRWDGMDKAGNALPSGMYFARLTAPEYSETIKMLLLK
jgi:hypothetical protein